MSLEPVRMNSDELYYILRKRIFEKLPAEARSLRWPRPTPKPSETPDRWTSPTNCRSSLPPASRPLTPSTRPSADLYARFRENPGFQQTRGLIRIMRIVTSRLWNSGEAEKRYLISAQDLDFNDRETRT